MPNLIIIGTGPAGISAALYTVRSGIKTTVIGRDTGSLEKTDKIENYYGFEEPITGKALSENGILQAKRLGAEVIIDEVVSLDYKYDKNFFIVKTKLNEYNADSVILATGIARNTPKTKGLKELEGKGVSYCAVCDGFFYKGKDVTVLGDGEYALHEASELLPIVKSVTLLTDGKELSNDIKVKIDKDIKINTKEISAFSGEKVLEKVEFKDNTILLTSGVFVALGVASSSNLARKLGAQVDGTKIVVDSNMSSNIPGLYAAGDCTGGMLQVAKAVYEGAKAGTEAVKFLRSISKK